MALTRDFKDTVAARVQRDPRFREALFTEAINAYLGGDSSVIWPGAGATPSDGGGTRCPPT